MDLLRIQMALGNAAGDTPVQVRADDLHALLIHYEETDDYDELVFQLEHAKREAGETEEAMTAMQDDLDKVTDQRDELLRTVDELNGALATEMAA